MTDGTRLTRGTWRVGGNMADGAGGGGGVMADRVTWLTGPHR